MKTWMNPGTGEVRNATPEQAAENMPQLLIDAGYPNAAYRPSSHQDYGEGRYCFIVTWEGRQVEVQMPGLPIEQVRFLGHEGQNIWHYPRLYIDGSSWVWLYAKDQIRDRFEPKGD